MKKITVILSLLLCLLILCSCGGTQEPETTLTTETTTGESTTKATTTKATTQSTTAEMTSAATSSEAATKATTTAAKKPSAAEKSLKKLKAKLEKTGDYFAVAYVGYYEGGYKEVKAELKKTGITEKYPFIGEITKKDFYALDGNQVYVIVPAKGITVKLHQCSFNADGILTLIDSLGAYDNGKPFIIKGNISDSRPDFHIEAYKDGEIMLSYNPVLSMEDGKLYGVKGMLDFTPYSLLPFYS